MFYLGKGPRPCMIIQYQAHETQSYWQVKMLDVTELLAAQQTSET